MGRGKREIPKTLQCINCGSDIIKRYTETVEMYINRKFCKPKCQHLYNTIINLITTQCFVCGIEFKRCKWQVDFS